MQDQLVEMDLPAELAADIAVNLLSHFKIPPLGTNAARLPNLYATLLLQQQCPIKSGAFNQLRLNRFSTAKLEFNLSWSIKYDRQR